MQIPFTLHLFAQNADLLTYACADIISCCLSALKNRLIMTNKKCEYYYKSIFFVKLLCFLRYL